MSNRQNWNQQFIEEFRANNGKTTGPFANIPMLLLTTTGAKTGRSHTNPVTYLPDGDRILIFASKGGAPTNPDWYHNLVAHPEVTVEVPNETFQAKAVVIKGEERDRLYAKQVVANPAFGDYERKTTRKIPVISLERRKG